MARRCSARLCDRHRRGRPRGVFPLHGRGHGRGRGNGVAHRGHDGGGRAHALAHASARSGHHCSHARAPARSSLRGGGARRRNDSVSDPHGQAPRQSAFACVPAGDGRVEHPWRALALGAGSGPDDAGGQGRAARRPAGGWRGICRPLRAAHKRNELCVGQRARRRRQGRRSAAIAAYPADANPIDGRLLALHGRATLFLRKTRPARAGRPGAGRAGALCRGALVGRRQTQARARTARLPAALEWMRFCADKGQALPAPLARYGEGPVLDADVREAVREVFEAFAPAGHPSGAGEPLLNEDCRS